MTSDKQTTTINGLRLVSPEEAGYRNVDIGGVDVAAVILRNGLVHGYLTPLAATVQGVSNLQELPKPRTTRPYKRGEVKCGYVFRLKETGIDRIVTRVDDSSVHLNGWMYTFDELLKTNQRLTYDSEGREVLSEAGVEE